MPGPGQSMHTVATEDSVIILEGVSKYFVTGKRKIAALQNVDMFVRRGIITGLIGPDGAGKTTLMRMSTGLLAPDAGKITILGIDATSDSLLMEASIGYMPQRFGLYEDLTVMENMKLYADLHEVPEELRPPRFEELLHMTGLGPFISRLAGRLSGGMKQKLGLACTLVRPPQLLLLDEPTVGVDPVSRRELWSIVYRLVREEGMSVLLSTAYLDEAERCNDVILFHEGRLLGQGPPESFSEPMQGHTYSVSVPGMKNRVLQGDLLRCPDVTDAVVQGDRVRLVMEGTVPPEPAALLPSAKNMSLTPVRPRFEDAFISILRRSRPVSLKTADEGIVTAAHTGTSDDHIIEVKNVQRKFGDFYAVKRITFSVKKGEVFGLLGANGAGKSTTFRMLCGLLPPSAGNLSVAGVDLRKAPAAARAHIGYMSQKFSLYGNLSVRENLRFFGSTYGLSGRTLRENIQWALERFDLGDHEEITSAELPLGHKQRLAMACALMHNPDILFLDEPTSGVDPIARREFWHRINTLAERGVTVMVTTHFMEEAEYCDSLAVMSAGEILALGTPAEIKAKAVSADLPEPTMEDAFISLISDNAPAQKTS
ncbi:MAG: ATP-binding cassette domain-containing protein [Desulfobacteraceae bacterium]|nr:ATP-binding cassette domain-containing protein [Desulfobacteraceae bacterium]